MLWMVFVQCTNVVCDTILQNTSKAGFSSQTTPRVEVVVPHKTYFRLVNQELSCPQETTPLGSRKIVVTQKVTSTYSACTQIITI